MHFTIRDQMNAVSLGTSLGTAAVVALEQALSVLVGDSAARRVLSKVGEPGLTQLGATELSELCHLDEGSARFLVAARDLGQALCRPRPSAKNSADLLLHLPPSLAALEHEVMLGVALDGKLGIKAVLLLAKGGLAVTTLTPKDVFVPLVRYAASAAVLVHNHPSGDPTPSQEDVAFTNEVTRLGRSLSIDIVDHLVVAASGTVSFADSGLLLCDNEMDPAPVANAAARRA